MAASLIKLLNLVDSLGAGGMENITVQVMNHLPPSRFDVTVCCVSSEGAFASRLSPSIRSVVLHKPPGFSIATVRQLRSLFAQGIDLVHTHHLGGLIYAVLARGARTWPRIVHSEHIALGAADRSWKRIWQRRLLYPLASCVFTVSQEQFDQLHRLGLRHRDLFVLRNGVDCERFTPPAAPRESLRESLGLPAPGFWFGQVARFAPAKRHLDLIEAFEMVSDRHASARLLLVGDGGPEKERVLQRIALSPFRERIHCAGLQLDPVPWYQALDILVIPSLAEGLPNAALEGMACGLPLLANEACGVREVATHQEHGWIGDFSTASGLAQALEHALCTPPAMLQDMGSRSRQRITEHFSKDRMLIRYEQLYARVHDA